MFQRVILFWLFLLMAITLLQCNSSIEKRKGSILEYSTSDTVAIRLLKQQSDTIDKSVILEQVIHVPLTLIVDNLKSAHAPVVVGVYTSNKDFLYKEGRLNEYRFNPNGKVLKVTIADLEYGIYAISIYQDYNSSGKFDKNIFGMPKEGYAFSNNFKPKTKAPEFDDCKFKYDSENHTMRTDLIQ